MAPSDVQEPREDTEGSPCRRSNAISKRVPPRELSAAGILFQINRQILHPLGMELTMVDDHLFVDRCAEAEGLVFSEQELIDGMNNFTQYMRTTGLPIVKQRVAKYKFVVQGGIDGI